VLLLVAGAVACQPGDSSERPAQRSFDYWILALSWSPEYCASREARPGSRQCSSPHEFVVHGLWPQFERGHPEFCDTSTRVDERIARRLEPLVPDRGLVFHQWKKHGSCSGMGAESYFATLEKARAAIKVPASFLASAAERRVRRIDLEQAFVDLNPGMSAQSITFQCTGGRLREVRVCLGKDLAPRACGADVDEACGRELGVRAVD
jgi:ribonuclease T2